MPEVNIPTPKPTAPPPPPYIPPPVNNDDHREQIIGDVVESTDEPNDSEPQIKH